MPLSLSHSVGTLLQTFEFGRSLAGHLFPGAVLALIGPLGAGKTHLTKAIAEGLGIGNSASVTSPTFVLIQEYDARLPIFHFDAYRLKDEAEFADLGPHEYFQGNGISIVEWADKVPGCLPEDHLVIRIVPTGETSRRFEVTGHGERYEKLTRSIGDV